MVKFNCELPNDLIKQFEKLETTSEKMMEEMVDKGGDVVINNINNNMHTVFKTTGSLQSGLTKTRIYKTNTDDGINVRIGFYGYKQTKNGGKYKMIKTLKGGKKQTYSYDGVPIPLIAMAREFGSNSGESKKPFLRKSFKRLQIESAMKSVQGKYLPKD